MNQQDYFILWSVYYMAAVIALFACIFFTNFLWRFIKEPIVIVTAILLFSPTSITADQSAPAIAVLSMDFLMGIGDHVPQILNELISYIEIALAVYFGFAIFIRWPVEHSFRKWRNKKKAAASNTEPKSMPEAVNVDTEVAEVKSTLQTSETA